MIPTTLTINNNLEAEAVLFVKNDANRIATRLGGVLKLYFINDDPEKRDHLFKIAEEYMAYPDCAVTHFMTNEGRRNKLPQRNRVPDYFLNKRSDPEGFDADVDIYEDLGCDYYSVPCWHFMGTVFGADFRPYKLSGIEAHFPPQLMTRDSAKLQKLALGWAERLGALHGSFGFGVLGTPGSETSTEAYWFPWLSAYPAVDQGSLGVYWAASRRGGHELPFTSNWLTFLGDANIARLGGKGIIRADLRDQMALLPFSGGAAIRAYDVPALGNKASGGVPEGYRTAARIIKPIRFEGYKRGIIKTPREWGYSREQDLQVTLDWVRRFD
ncbi:type VI immunity family protein [Rhodovulum sulfidophilum]|uniref:type VI immunity family protein n=1 Tax=Rhodovulum sulfidophilum TaxID=35806 RepID=UPI0019227781|nr:type VI immunity family protein [Rhodovulum sulfidophilum]MBL3561126.1 DUF3396 domain-containing protein [Rhodovulum sulfidophilum]